MVIVIVIILIFVALAVGISVFYRSKVKKVIVAHDRKFAQLKATGMIPEKMFRKPEIVPDSGKRVWYNYLAFDFTHNLCAFEYQVFSMENIVEIQMINDTSVVQSASSKIGGGAVLGVVVPGVAAFGGQSQMKSGEKTSVVAIRVLLDDPRMPSLMIPFLFGIADKASKDYQDSVTIAYEVYGVFEMAVKKNKQKELAKNTRDANATNPVKKCRECGATLHGEAKFCHICSAKIVPVSNSVQEQLESLKKLRESGILTEQEYTQKYAKLTEESKKGFCKKCGKPLNPEQKFCASCGEEST